MISAATDTTMMITTGLCSLDASATAQETRQTLSTQKKTLKGQFNQTLGQHYRLEEIWGELSL